MSNPEPRSGRPGRSYHEIQSSFLEAENMCVNLRPYRLDHQVEGWAALAGLTPGRTTECRRHRAVTVYFCGSDRPRLDYFVEEVLYGFGSGLIEPALRGLLSKGLSKVAANHSNHWHW